MTGLRARIEEKKVQDHIPGERGYEVSLFSATILVNDEEIADLPSSPWCKTPKEAVRVACAYLADHIETEKAYDGLPFTVDIPFKGPSGYYLARDPRG